MRPETMVAHRHRPNRNDLYFHQGEMASMGAQAPLIGGPTIRDSRSAGGVVRQAHLPDTSARAEYKYVDRCYGGPFSLSWAALALGEAALQNHRALRE
jgi:hypothetical protein